MFCYALLLKADLEEDHVVQTGLPRGTNLTMTEAAAAELQEEYAELLGVRLPKAVFQGEA